MKSGPPKCSISSTKDKRDFFFETDAAGTWHRFFIVMIRFDQVSFAYPKSTSGPALDKLTFELKRGEDLVVMGGNGSGKTTLGLLLCGILKPDSGQIIIDNPGCVGCGCCYGEHSAFIDKADIVCSAATINTSGDRC